MPDPSYVEPEDWDAEEDGESACIHRLKSSIVQDRHYVLDCQSAATAMGCAGDAYCRLARISLRVGTRVRSGEFVIPLIRNPECDVVPCGDHTPTRLCLAAFLPK